MTPIDLIGWLLVAGLVVFGLAMILSKPFRDAMIRRFQGEAASAAQRISEPMANMDLAIAQTREAKSKVSSAYATVVGKISTLEKKRTEAVAKRKSWDEAAQRYAKAGDEDRVRQCLERMNRFDEQINELDGNIDNLRPLATSLEAKRGELDSKIEEYESRKSRLLARAETAEAMISVKKTMTDTGGSTAGLFEEAERMVQGVEEQVEGLQALIDLDQAEANQEEELLSVLSDTDQDDQVRQYMKRASANN